MATNFFVYLTHLFIGESENILVSAVVLGHVSVSTLPLLLQVDARHQEVEHHRRIEVGIELGKDLEKQTEKNVRKRHNKIRLDMQKSLKKYCS